MKWLTLLFTIVVYTNGTSTCNNYEWKSEFNIFQRNLSNVFCEFARSQAKTCKDKTDSEQLIKTVTFMVTYETSCGIIIPVIASFYLGIVFILIFFCS